MPALSTNKSRSVLDNSHASKFPAVIATGQVLWEGALLCYSAAASTVANAADTVGFRVAGVYCGSAQTAAAGATCEVECGQIEYFLQDGNLTAASGCEGKNAIILDNATMTTAAVATNDVPAGKIVKVDGTVGVWVHVGIFAPTNA